MRSRWLNVKNERFQLNAERLVAIAIKASARGNYARVGGAREDLARQANEVAANVSTEYDPTRQQRTAYHKCQLIGKVSRLLARSTQHVIGSE